MFLIGKYDDVQTNCRQSFLSLCSSVFVYESIQEQVECLFCKRGRTLSLNRVNCIELQCSRFARPESF